MCPGTLQKIPGYTFVAFQPKASCFAENEPQIADEIRVKMRYLNDGIQELWFLTTFERAERTPRSYRLMSKMLNVLRIRSRSQHHPL